MKRYFTTLIILFFTFCLFSQRNEGEIALREYFVDAEFFLTQEFYADALNDYMQVYKRGYKDNPNINYRIGICYLEIPGQKAKSIEYLEKAAPSASLKYKESSLNEKMAPIDVYLYLGNAYRVNNRLDDAIKAYKRYKEFLPEEETNLHQYADKQIEACNIANEFMSKPIGLTMENLGSAVNSSNEDYNAVISGDQNTLVYMHKLPFYDAIYISKKVDGAWTKPENITPQIMSDGNQYVNDISYDGKTIYLNVEDEFNSDIYVSHYVDNSWSQSEPLGSDINTKYWESHASISEDGNTLYFTSNRSGGVGNMDIYRATKDLTGNFSNVVNLKELNSDLNEDTPFITADGKTIYFSSQGFTNMGGYDIFSSNIGMSGQWTVPENIGYPVSSTDDDLFYFPWNNGEESYIALIADEGFGATDIYKIKFKEEVVEHFVQKASESEMPEVIKEKIESAVAITESDTTLPEVASEKITKASVEQKEDDAASKIQDIIIAEQEKAIEITSVELSPVFFEFDRSQLSESGKVELNKLVDLMNSNKNLSTVFIGFADALGPETYNLSLSEKRAMAAMRYLVSKGIPASRLKAIGKGESDFIAPNTKPDGSDYPEGRKFNRRIEFEITGVDANSLMIKRLDPVPVEMKKQMK